MNPSKKTLEKSSQQVPNNNVDKKVAKGKAKKTAVYYSPQILKKLGIFENVKKALENVQPSPSLENCPTSKTTHEAATNKCEPRRLSSSASSTSIITKGSSSSTKSPGTRTRSQLRVSKSEQLNVSAVTELPQTPITRRNARNNMVNSLKHVNQSTIAATTSNDLNESTSISPFPVKTNMNEDKNTKTLLKDIIMPTITTPNKRSKRTSRADIIDNTNTASDMKIEMPVKRARKSRNTEIEDEMKDNRIEKNTSLQAIANLRKKHHKSGRACIPPSETQTENPVLNDQTNNSNIEFSKEDLKKSESTLVETGSGPISLDITFVLNDETQVRKQGRPKKAEVINNPSVVHYDLPSKNGKINKGVKCVACHGIILKAAWSMHNQKCHNNISWREGDTPVDLSSRDQVISLWNMNIKKKIPLRCAKCGIKKLSALGFYSHISVCGKNEEEIEKERVQCPICQNRMLAVSIKPHIALVHNDTAKKKKMVNTDVIPYSSNEKRVAASKALDRFKGIDTEPEMALEDMFSSVKRGDKIPSYYQTVWKRQLNDKKVAKCTSPKCEYTIGNIEDMLKHHEDCPMAPGSDYCCKLCSFYTTKEQAIMHHVKKAHVTRENGKEIIADENWTNVGRESSSDEEIIEIDKTVTKPRKNSVVIYRKFDFLLVLQLKYNCNPSLATFKWTSQFRYDNYSKYLFDDHQVILANWKELHDDNNEYLPKTKNSIGTSHVLLTDTILKHISAKHDWKSYNLFESTFSPNEATLFCGGPVTALAWLPGPEASNSQYLAVSCNNNMDEFHHAARSYIKPGLIQIWSLGSLNNEEKITQEPKMCLGIAHKYGIVWHMEWCPSGCYQLSERLGLLASGCSDGNVYIFSVPFPETLPSNIGKDEKCIFTTQPAFKLILMESTSYLPGERNYQVTKINWSRLSGHSIIAAGFSNGIIALWNLTTTSALLREQEEFTTTLLPYISFQGHLGPITAVSLCNFDTVRWVFTASMDRCYKFWDLHDTTFPISEFKRGFATDGCWVPHWNCAVVTCDDVLIQSNTVTPIISIRDFGFKSTPLLRSKSAVRSIAANECLNMLAQVSSAGELQVAILPQMFQGMDKERVFKNTAFMCAFADYIDLSKSPSELLEMRKLSKSANEVSDITSDKLTEISIDVAEEIAIGPEDYKETVNKYGLVFCDFNLTRISALPEEARYVNFSSDILRTFPGEMYPIVAMTRVAWNPNTESCRYLAVGYQAGFVRIHCPRLTIHYRKY